MVCLVSLGLSDSNLSATNFSVTVLDQSPWAISLPIATRPGTAIDDISQLMDTGVDPDGVTPAEPIRKGSAQPPLTVHGRPRSNRERIIQFPAGKRKSPKWPDWMTEQHFQDGLQRRSWIRDQSVVEPGKVPGPLLYGATRELQMRVGSSMPTVYARRLTPTDIGQLQDENQKLRNQVLDRIFACPICDEEFKTDDKEKVRTHVREHQQQLEEVGQCPSCGDSSWAFMTNDEKRMHFAAHQHHHKSMKIQKFYNDQRCPVCDREFSKLKPELVVRHCLEHAPGQLQFCDRCGLHETDCNIEELNHHHLKCRLAEEKQLGDPEPEFCKFSGLNITALTSTEKLDRVKAFLEGSSGKFCPRCGLDETGSHWSRAAIAEHDSHCVAPSGFAKKFCEKCGIKVASLDGLRIANHQRTCRMVEPKQPSDWEQLLGMNLILHLHP